MDVSQMVNSAPHVTNVASVTRLRTGDFSLSVNSANKSETIGADNVQNPPIFIIIKNLMKPLIARTISDFL